MKKLLNLLALSAMTLVLSTVVACGGGGGSKSSSAVVDSTGTNSSTSSTSVAGETDEQKVAAAKAALTLQGTINTNLTLKVKDVNNIDISWASNHPAIIIESGVAKPTRGIADVTGKLVATLSLNSVTETKEFDVLVEKLPPIDEDDTVAEALATAVGTEVTVSGIALASNFYADYYFVCDSTGCIFVKGQKSGGLSPQTGQTVKVTGTRNFYKGFADSNHQGTREITPTSSEILDSTIKPLPDYSNIAVAKTVEEASTKVEFNNITDANTPSCKLYKIEGYIIGYRNPSASDDTYEIVPEYQAANPYITFYHNTNYQKSDIAYAQYTEFMGKDVKLEVIVVVYDNNKSGYPYTVPVTHRIIEDNRA